MNWGYNRRLALEAHDRADWQRLALIVLDVGYNSDLAYYYLGRAAEGMGANDAALTYYRKALEITNHRLFEGQGKSPGERCNFFLSRCDGFEFPADIENRISALKP